MSNLTKSNFRRRAKVETNECGLALAANIFGDKWVLLILREAFYAVVRFEDIQKDIGIPRAILSTRLARLVDQGILIKQPYQEPKSRIRHSYHLSKKGRTLAKVLVAMMEWGNEYLLKSEPKLAIVDVKSKSPLRIGLFDKNNCEVPIKFIALEPINKKL
ncbi:MAG: helix-turn-helix transcriptional regulator [Caulobacterales bacterium]|nr:helix-turn-helix transcriptional regulator [Caulobacterales bacterium]